ncbi:hypothetical protein M5689_024560 [Euphorbia peplus]|nr:hypothetical protein M5689_024560 [Euphorbia peplus]
MLQTLKDKFTDLKELDCKIPSRTDMMFTGKGRKFAALERLMEFGLRFPLPEVVIDILNEFNLCPAQIVPNSWLEMMALARVCEDLGILLSGNLFKYMRTPIKATGHTCVSFNTIRGPKSIVRDKLSSHCGYKQRWIWVGPSKDELAWPFRIDFNEFPTNPRSWRNPSKEVILTKEEQLSFTMLLKYKPPT